jgi:hypothetical protein
MSKKRLYVPVAALIIAMLAACNLPQNQTQSPGPDAAFTAAAQTVEAQLTGAAQTQAVSAVPTATNTLLPSQATLTPTATSALLTAPPASTQSCDQAQFITDVTIPDGTNIPADDNFTKTWRIRNTGTCSWNSSYTLAFASGNSMSGPSTLPLAGTVNAGSTVDISVNLKAPSSPGDYTGFWKLRNASGSAFITMTVVIHVGGSGEFRVTHVDFDSSSGGCGAYHAVASITTNGPGTVTYYWVWSDGATDTASHAPLTFGAAGTQSVSTDWNTTGSGSHWIDIYIDSPNHQQLGRGTFSCP